MNEVVKKFFEELKNNEKALEILKTSAISDSGADVSILARAARETGYEVSDEDIQEYVMQAQKLQASASDAVSDQIRGISIDELDSVAGGGNNDDCVDTYRYGENCNFLDECNHFFIDYDIHHCNGSWD